jgi:hypothetical protein
MSVAPVSPPAPPSVNAPRPFLLWQSFARFLYNQNPFYLLSVAFVLHGTKLWYRDPRGGSDPWPLMAIICGYILLLAATGFALVRLGRVWDDARSILLTLLLLFVELSLTFDGVLIARRGTGILLLFTGWLVAVSVSEGILRGLKMRLPPLYRVPYHLLLLLLFFYPLWIVSSYGDNGQTAQWRIYLFSPAAALVLLTLLPAVRQGAHGARDSGTPWNWPLYPWSIFVVLGVCITLRAYALCLAFDPVLSQSLREAMRLESAFGGYFLVPLLFATAVLLLEAGIVSRRATVRFAALCLPVVGVLLSLPGATGSLPHDEFVARFTSGVGSPLWSASIAAAAFFAWARFRQVRAAEIPGIVLAVMALGLERKNAFDSVDVQLSEVWLWMLAAAGCWLGVRHRDPRAWLIATASALIAARGSWLDDAGWMVRDALPAHLALGAMLAIGLLYETPFARRLRRLAAGCLGAAAMAATLLPQIPGHAIPETARIVYALGMSAGALGIARKCGGPRWLSMGFAGLASVAGRLLVDLSQFLERDWHWAGAGYFVVGMVWFGLALVISVMKAGLVRIWRTPPPPRADQAIGPGG